MKPKNNRIFCIGCHRSKMLFESEEKAANFIKFNREEISQSSSKVPLRAYYCSFCCGWHVTSVSDKASIDVLEARDKRKWERIRAGRNRGMSRPQETVRFLDFEAAVEEYRHLGRLTDMVLSNIQQAEADFRNLDLVDAAMHSRFAREYLSEADTFALKNNLHFARKRKLEMITVALDRAFDIIREYEVYHETRMIYLNLHSGSVNPYARTFLRNKDFIEETDSKLSELETLVKCRVKVPVEGWVEEIESNIESYIREIPSECMCKKVRKKTKQFERRLALIRTNVGVCDGIAGNEDKTKTRYLAIIDILEKAHAAYAKRYYTRFSILIRIAEKMMPDENDEIADTLRLQIRKMKDAPL